MPGRDRCGRLGSWPVSPSESPATSLATSTSTPAASTARPVGPPRRPCSDATPGWGSRWCGSSRVRRTTRRRALMALVACPTASIGTVSKRNARRRRTRLSRGDRRRVSTAAGTPRKPSFGASSYLIRRPRGNVLVDSPRAARPLLRAHSGAGGRARHVPQPPRRRRRPPGRSSGTFGCQRILHAADVAYDTREVEWQLQGEQIRSRSTTTCWPSRSPATPGAAPPCCTATAICSPATTCGPTRTPDAWPCRARSAGIRGARSWRSLARLLDHRLRVGAAGSRAALPGPLGR